MIRGALYGLFSLIAEKKIRRLIDASKRPSVMQRQKLLDIIGRNSSSEFGKQHSFGSIGSVEEYQRAVPMRDYEQLSPYIERCKAGEKSVLTADDPFMFATTSGTTANPKFIPITRDYIEEFRLASVITGYHLLKTFPRMSRGVTLSVVSPAEEGRTESGVPYGAISGQLFQHEPFLIKKYISPIPYEVFLIGDCESRYYTLLRLALGLQLSCLYTLNPSTITLLCRRLQLHADRLIDDVRKGKISPPAALPGSTLKAIGGFLSPDGARADKLAALLSAGQFVPHRIWPELAVVSCWTKAAASFYLADFPEYFGSVPVSDITYGASEGRGTVFMGPEQQMLAIQSHFFEFVPEDEIDAPNPNFLLAEEVEVGKCYYLLFTTSGGLYRYNINDVMKVTGFFNGTPLLEFQYKGGNISSFTGEKITEFQVTQAMRTAAECLGVKLRFFTVIPQFRPEPHYEVWVESASGACLGSEFSGPLARAFDEEMRKVNIEYATKRTSGRLADIICRQLSPDSYESFRKHLVSLGIADAQVKVSHLNPKTEVREYFQERLLRKSTTELSVLSSI